MEILNYRNGQWNKPSVKEYFEVINPARGQMIAQTPLCSAEKVAAAVAFTAWSVGFK
jgi:acyl-CoA reductase-like NAD-dependent aldehyde dehydrogenase